jgi:ketosteroid isomerase-like protein
MAMENEQLIRTFYTAFQQKDYVTMQACYAESARFSDPVFQNLNAAEVKAMWEMLCKNGKDLQLEFSNVSANEDAGSAGWKATYTFSTTGRKVVNHITANFKFEGGKILRHDDQFSFYKWSRQALGLSGWLLGWSPFLKNKVRKTARRNLAVFMKITGPAQ